MFAVTTCVCNPHIQESPHPRAPKSPKSLKRGFPGLPARSVKKVSKKSQMTQKRVKKTTKSVFGDFFDTFLTLRAGRPRNPLLRLFGDFGARGCGDSCIWGLHTQVTTRLWLRCVIRREFGGNMIGATGPRASEREICL